MARPLPVFGFCQPCAKCLRMICEKKPSVVGAGLREELACQKSPRTQRVSWSNEGSYEEQLRTPYHPTAEFTRLITAAQREMSSCTYTYTQNVDQSWYACFISYLHMNKFHIEHSVLVESWVQLIWCRDFRAQGFCLRNGWLLLRASFQFIICKKDRGYLKLNVGHFFDTRKLWNVKSKWMPLIFVLIPASVFMVFNLLNVALVYIRLPRVVCVVLIKMWRNLADMGNTWMGLHWCSGTLYICSWKCLFRVHFYNRKRCFIVVVIYLYLFINWTFKCFPCSW